MLPYSRRRGTVVLTRQFRLPPFVGGQVDGMLLEAPGGLLDGQRPAEAARREVEEETGWRLGPLTEVCVLYMSPAVMTERVHCFVANVDEGARLVHRRPRADEGEDVEVLELPFATALRMVTSGEIVDGRTIVLLQFAELQALVGCL